MIERYPEHLEPPEPDKCGKCGEKLHTGIEVDEGLCSYCLDDKYEESAYKR